MSAVNNDSDLFLRAHNVNSEKMKNYLEVNGYLKGRELRALTLIKDEVWPIDIHTEQSFMRIAFLVNRTKDFLTYHIMQLEPCKSYALAVCTTDKEVGIIKISSPQGSRIARIRVMKDSNSPNYVTYKQQMIDPSLNDQ